MTLYSIKDWAKHYETSETKRLVRLTWVPTKNKHDGKGFRRLMRYQDGLEVFGAWMLILQVASKAPVRGVLQDADGPMSAPDIADKVGCDPSKIERALKLLSVPEIGWIDAREINTAESAISDIPLQDPAIPVEHPATPTDALQCPADLREHPATPCGPPGRIEGTGLDWTGSITPTPNGSGVVQPPVATPNPERAKPWRDVIFDEQFWPAVWLKRGKGAARRMWARKITDKEHAKRVIAAAVLQGPMLLREAIDRANRHGDAVSPLHPATWLHEERYDDEMSAETSKPIPAAAAMDEWVPRDLGQRDEDYSFGE